MGRSAQDRFRPRAMFWGMKGQVIGTTNEGQLEPARRYSSKQILKFVRDIAEKSRIGAPDLAVTAFAYGQFQPPVHFVAPPPRDHPALPGRP